MLILLKCTVRYVGLLLDPEEAKKSKEIILKKTSKNVKTIKNFKNTQKITFFVLKVHIEEKISKKKSCLFFYIGNTRFNQSYPVKQNPEEKSQKIPFFFNLKKKKKIMLFSNANAN